MDDKEYSYLYALITCYSSTLPRLFVDSLHNGDPPPYNTHLVAVHFFLEDERMLKLAHASMDDKNHKFMHDLHLMLDTLDRID